jgi:hypothetical protein
MSSCVFHWQTLLSHQCNNLFLELGLVFKKNVSTFMMYTGGH